MSVTKPVTIGVWVVRKEVSTNNTHKSQASSSLEEQKKKKGKRLTTSGSVGIAVTMLERSIKFHEGRVWVTFFPVISAPNSA